MRPTEHDDAEMVELRALVGAQDLLARYAQAMDGRRLDECLSLFADDAVLEVGGETHVGGSAIRAWMDQLAQSPPGRHFTTNVVVATDDDRVVARADFLFVRAIEGTPTILAMGRYHDDLVQIDGDWRFAHRQITMG